MGDISYDIKTNHFDLYGGYGVIALAYTGNNFMYVYHH